MKKIWSYIALFFVGLSTGLLIAIRTAGDTYKIGINKLKQKGKGNTQDSELDVNLTPQTKPQSRLERRYERKQNKIIKRNAKKQKKALQNLDTFNLN